MPCKQACRHTAIMVLCYLIIQMAETSASGLGGDTKSEPRSCCRALDLDLGGLPFEHQAPITLCDDHILIRPLQDPQLNRSSPRIARIQNAVGGRGGIHNQCRHRPAYACYQDESGPRSPRPARTCTRALRTAREGGFPSEGGGHSACCGKEPPS